MATYMKIKSLFDLEPKPDDSHIHPGHPISENCLQEVLRDFRLKRWEELDSMGREFVFKVLTDKLRSFQVACEQLCLSPCKIKDFLLAHTSNGLEAEWANLGQDAKAQSIAKAHACLAAIGKSGLSEALGSFIRFPIAFILDIDISDFNREQLVLAYRDSGGFPPYADFLRGSRRLNPEDLWKFIVFEASQERRDKFRVRSIVLPKGAKVVGPEGVRVLPHGGKYDFVYEDDKLNCRLDKFVLSTPCSPVFDTKHGDMHRDSQFVPYSRMLCNNGVEPGAGELFSKGNEKTGVYLFPLVSSHRGTKRSDGAAAFHMAFKYKFVASDGLVQEEPVSATTVVEAEGSSNMGQRPPKRPRPDDFGTSQNQHQHVVGGQGYAHATAPVETPRVMAATRASASGAIEASGRGDPDFYPRDVLEGSNVHGPLFKKELPELKEFEDRCDKHIIAQFRLPAGYWVVSPNGGAMIFDAGQGAGLHQNDRMGVGGVYTFLLPQRGPPLNQAVIHELDDRVELRIHSRRIMAISLNGTVLPRRTNPGLHEFTSLWSPEERNTLDLVSQDGRYYLFEGMAPTHPRDFTLGRRRDDGVFKEVLDECKATEAGQAGERPQSPGHGSTAGNPPPTD